MTGTYGGKIIAQALHDLGVKVIFGLPGLPVTDIGQEGLYLGIRFISFRNEQAAVYAATAYGYLTGRPGVCICVGGPGIIHAMAGIPHATANSWPLLVLAGSSETHNAGRGAFQEVDAIAMLTPHTKKAVRPPTPELVPKFIRDAYRAAYFGRPGSALVDLPANLILGTFDVPRNQLVKFKEPPLSVAPENKIEEVVQVLKAAKAPLVVLGKGCAYARAEKHINALIDMTGLPFVPTPMGKGVIADSSPNNYSAARSTALKEADVVLVLGAKLNWILSFGEAPKWNPKATIIQVDITADELGQNAGHPELSLVGDVGLVVERIVEILGGWQWQGQFSAFSKSLKAAQARNEEKAAKKAAVSKNPITFEHSYDVIKRTLNSLSNPSDGDICYVSEGANAMDISRSIFALEHPRLKLDAGTYATMGVGLGYAIAAWAAYNLPQPEGNAGAPGRKKIVAIEGDSAFGFSGMEVETMARFQMDVLIFVMNNNGLYRGDTNTTEDWEKRQKNTVAGTTQEKGAALSAWSLGYQTNYQKVAEMAGGIGIVARTPEELIKATEIGYKATVPVVVNVIIDPQADLEMDFSWLDMAPPKKEAAKL
ncbi:Putative TPP-binding domain containing protein HACL1 [Septoria linicola]|uniref:2-hydroxyacyl-CoA lyase n=1 Tax=Septoria linicola TaxID=215465 RepID=A0A9Q9EKG3_9PEZI|nr:putative TPP-binding domain containing protein HACL1 [Septoria linicola]USW53252.1 Putative TPP-binding domain containing protein HACL1 [Septoria linicola]